MRDALTSARASAAEKCLTARLQLYSFDFIATAALAAEVASGVNRNLFKRTLIFVSLDLVFAARPFVAGEFLRHVGENVGHHRKRGDVLAELYGIDLVERVSFGVVPVEVVGRGRHLAEAGNAGKHQRLNIRTTAAGTDGVRADRLQQRCDVAEQVERVLFLGSKVQGG